MLSCQKSPQDVEFYCPILESCLALVIVMCPGEYDGFDVMQVLDAGQTSIFCIDFLKYVF